MHPALAVAPAPLRPDEPPTPTAALVPAAVPEVVSGGAPPVQHPEVIKSPGASMLSAAAAANTPFEASDSIDQIVGAIADAQADFEPLYTSETANVKSRREGGANYTYRYATLADVLGVVRGPLGRRGVAIIQPPSTVNPNPQTKGVRVLTILAHRSGQFIRSSLTLQVDSFDPQSVGSAATYARRYSLTGMLGLAPEDPDDDGGRALPRSNSGTHESHPHRPGAGPVAMPQRTSAAEPHDGPARGASDTAASAPAPGSVTFTVAGVDPRKKADGTPYWVVAFANADTGATFPACTFDVTLVNALLRMRTAGTRLCEVVTRQNGNWTFVEEVRIAQGGGQ